MPIFCKQSNFGKEPVWPIRGSIGLWQIFGQSETSTVFWYPRSRQISALQLSDLISTHQRPRRHHQESSESDTRPSVAWDRELHNGPRKMWTSWTAWLTAVVFTASVRAKTTSHVTCGSVIKLVNTYYDVSLSNCSNFFYKTYFYHCHSTTYIDHTNL